MPAWLTAIAHFLLRRAAIILSSYSISPFITFLDIFAPSHLRSPNFYRLTCYAGQAEAISSSLAITLHLDAATMDLSWILEDVRHILGCTGLHTFADLGKMRQTTLEQRLRAARSQLTRRSEAYIYAMWLRGQVAHTQDSARKTAVGSMVAFFASSGDCCSFETLLRVWEDCAADSSKMEDVKMEMKVCCESPELREKEIRGRYHQSPSLHGESRPRQTSASLQQNSFSGMFNHANAENNIQKRDQSPIRDIDQKRPSPDSMQRPYICRRCNQPGEFGRRRSHSKQRLMT